MMRATKYILIVCVVLNFIGHPVKSRVVYLGDFMEEGHPFTYEDFKFGWPIPIVMITRIWGCLSIASLIIEVSWPGFIGSLLFWIVAIWIIDTFWPRARMIEAIRK